MNPHSKAFWQDEISLIDWISTHNLAEVCFLCPIGFEERSLGLLSFLAERCAIVGALVIAEYPSPPPDNPDPNRTFVSQAILLSKKVCARQVSAEIVDDGEWIARIAARHPGLLLVLDITALSGRLMFLALDVLSRNDRALHLAYFEAEVYWPTKADWEAVVPLLDDPVQTPGLVDAAPWLFGDSHHVEIARNHEGADSPGVPRALLGFLSFKPSRIASVLAFEEYFHKILVVGVPPAAHNTWRTECQRTVNSHLLEGAEVIEMTTFGVRDCLNLLRSNLIGPLGLLFRYNVHLTPLGSKLQTVASWQLCCEYSEITVIFSSPLTYYEKAFSQGIGKGWMLRRSPRAT